MKQTKDYLLDKYCFNEISDLELEQLQSFYANKFEFETETKLRMDIYKGIEGAGDIQIKKMLDKIHVNVVEKRNEKYKKKWLLGTLLFLLVALLAFFAWSSFNKNVTALTPMAMFDKNYETYQNSVETRSNNQVSVVTKFNTAYNEGEFEMALALIQPTLDNADAEIKLMAAISAIETQDLNSGKQILTEIINSNNQYYTDHALWYRALIFLKENNSPQAVQDLKNLTQDKRADHFDEAEQLLKLLSK